MSQENVEIVRQLFEAWRRNDAAAALAPLDPEIEFSTVVIDLGQKVYRGYAELSEYRADLEEVWEVWETRDERFIAVGDDCVVSLYHVSGRGKGSGTPVEQDVSIIFKFRGGRVVSMKAYANQGDALKAVGLSLQDAHGDS
jgi:ketosteroid isomerase-like protein